MTTTMSPTPEPEDDPFDQIERQIDWVEQLENVRIRHESLSASRDVVPYVEALRESIIRLAGRQTVEDLRLLHGNDIAELIDIVRRRDPDDSWNGVIKPALLREG